VCACDSTQCESAITVNGEKSCSVQCDCPGDCVSGTCQNQPELNCDVSVVLLTILFLYFYKATHRLLPPPTNRSVTSQTPKVVHQEHHAMAFTVFPTACVPTEKTNCKCDADKRFNSSFPYGLLTNDQLAVCSCDNAYFHITGSSDQRAKCCPDTSNCVQNDLKLGTNTVCR